MVYRALLDEKSHDCNHGSCGVGKELLGYGDLSSFLSVFSLCPCSKIRYIRHSPVVLR